MYSSGLYSPSIILDRNSLEEAVSYFLTQDSFAFDVEAQGDNRGVPHLASLSWISLATKGMAIAIPFGHPIGDNIIGETKEAKVYGPKAQKAGQVYYATVPLYEDPPVQLDASVVFDVLRPLFLNKFIRKGGHDVVYDLTSVSKYLGFVPPGPYFDTKILDWLIDENRFSAGLKDGIEKDYGFRYDFENIGKKVEAFPFSLVGYYSYCDSKYAYLRYLALIARIEDQGLGNIYDLEMSLLNTMVGMRLVGAKVDLDRLRDLQVTLTKKLNDAEAEVYKAAGRRFNINSNRQKQEILYVQQALRPWKLTQGGLDKRKNGLEITFNDYSVDDDVLASYPDNPVAIALREHGDISKLLSTYVSAWLGDEDKPSLIFDGHIHAGFQQYGTVTGRFSCRSPNLQNIPRPHTDLGKLIRGVFVADEGGKLVVADYGQIELVVLAHYVGEGALYEGFLRGIDPHTLTAAMVLDKEPVLCSCTGSCEGNHVTKVERQDLGKTLGFAVVYGAGTKKVASMAHVSVPRAKEILAKHAEMFPEIHDFKGAVIDLCRSRKPVPYITTLLGRKRRVPAINSSVDGIRLGAERQVFNSLIQGGAADLLKLAMIRVDSLIPPEVQVVMTVHDEIVLSAPDYLADEAAVLLKEAMIGDGIQKFVSVPLLADVKIVNKWDEAK